MTIEALRKQGLIILECISGSRAYGLATPNSDTDIKGVFLLPQKEYYGLDYIPQISNPSNDIVFYELRRFLELLALNNPNILELLHTPAHAILAKHPFIDEIQASIFLSKLCQQTFGKYALSQIKKAKGLKKKIVNPMDEERKSILSFCYVNYKQGAVPLLQFLAQKNWKQADCGLVNIPHMRNIYGLYHGENMGYNGIKKGENSNEVSLSSIPKGATQQALLYFNKDSYSVYCKEYREYWDWVSNRNEERYQNTREHGKNYDTKNMMHTFRLLEMAIEIGRDKSINVIRPERSFLLDIKKGTYAYADLLNWAETKRLAMEAAFLKTDLQEKPNLEAINKLAFQLRHKFYTEDPQLTQLIHYHSA